MNLLIVIIASAIIIFQTQYIFGAIGWAALHGANTSILDVWPLLVPLIVLWVGWLILKYTTPKYRTLFSVLLSIVIIATVEILMPLTPLKSYLQERAVDEVQVQNLSDEIPLSARGNPLGIRLTYDATFPRDGVYSISAGVTAQNEDYKFYDLQFGYSSPTVSPEPSQPEAGLRFYKAHTLYHFVEDHMPNFLYFDDSKKTYCIHLQGNTNYTDADVKSAIDNTAKVPYQTVVQISREVGFRVIKEYVTQHNTSLKEIYDGAIREGAKPCIF